MYTNRLAGEYFGVSKNTIRNWSNEFVDHFSPTGIPGNNQTRNYTVEDMQVLAHIAERRAHQTPYATIHAELKSGQRGEMPDLDPSQIQIISATGRERQLNLEVDALKQNIMILRSELEKAKAQADEAQQLRDMNVELKVRLEISQETQTKFVETSQQSQAKLEAQIQELTKEVKQLLRDSGKDYAKGFVDGIKNQPEDT